MMMTDRGSESVEEKGEEGEEEQLIQRHKREDKELRARVQAMKKSVPKGDKKKRKEVMAEVTRLEQEQWDRHERESAELGEESAVVGRGSGLSEKLHALGVSEEAGEREEQKATKSRALKRKEKKALQDRERQLRIAVAEEELSEDNPRLKEREELLSRLLPRGLAIKDVQPDGNCLYAAVCDQLQVRLGVKVSVAELRGRCADYIQSHSEDFCPYLTAPDSGELLSDAQFVQYCEGIRCTASWGGHLEIRALSQVFRVPMQVYQAHCPVLTIGEEYQKAAESLCLSYHHHEYGLGEHYNSVVPRNSN